MCVCVYICTTYIFAYVSVRIYNMLDLKSRDFMRKFASVASVSVNMRSYVRITNAMIVRTHVSACVCACVCDVSTY